MIKKLFLLFGLLSLGFSTDTECPAVSTIGDRRLNNNKLRLMQYNVEWLFIDYNSASDCPGDKCTWSNTSEAETHMTYVSNVIRTLNPDIVNFCEVEGCDELNMLVDELDPSYVPYLKKGTDSSTGQNVGMITRVDPSISLYRTEEKYAYPISGSKCGYTGSSSSGVSKHYITEFKVNQLYVAFISAHLIAIPTDSSRCAQREAQAMVLQQVIYSFFQKGYEVIMLGDFNDYDGVVLDMNGNKPISRVLEILKGNDGNYKGTYVLTNMAVQIQQEDRFSDWWDSDNNCDTVSNKDYSMIDHILVSKKLKQYVTNVFIYHGYEEYCGKYDSDHYPVVIDFEF